MPLRWQLHEAHETGLRKLYQELGFLDSQGQVRAFNGPKFWPAWTALGHSTSEFESCICQRKADGKQDPQGESA